MKTLIKIVMLIVVVLNSYCRNMSDDNFKITYKKSISSGYSEDGQKNGGLQVEPIEKIELVDGSQLRTSDLQISDKSVGKHHVMHPKLVPDERSDFVQYVICKKEEAGVCSPTLEEPGIFVSDEIEIPNPPSGVLDVKVRSCVRTYHSPSENNCGDWITTVYHQPQNPQSELALLLQEKFDKQEELRNMGSVVYQQTKSYAENNMNSLNLSEDKPLEKSFNTLVQNIVNMGEDVVSVVVSTPLLEIIESEAESAEVNSFSLSGGELDPSRNNDMQNGGLILLGIGGAFTGVAAVSLVGSVFKQIKKFEVSKLEMKAQTKLIEVQTKLIEVQTKLINTIENTHFKYIMELEPFKVKGLLSFEDYGRMPPAEFKKNMVINQMRWDQAEYNKFLAEVKALINSSEPLDEIRLNELLNKIQQIKGLGTQYVGRNSADLKAGAQGSEGVSLKSLLTKDELETFRKMDGIEMSEIRKDVSVDTRARNPNNFFNEINAYKNRKIKLEPELKKLQADGQRLQADGQRLQADGQRLNGESGRFRSGFYQALFVAAISAGIGSALYFGLEQADSPSSRLLSRLNEVYQHIKDLTKEIGLVDEKIIAASEESL